MKPIQERGGAEQSDQAIKRRLQKALNRAISDARVVLITPPTVRGFSGDSALNVELLDRSGGQLSLVQFEQVANAFIASAKETGKFERVSTRFDSSAPRWRLVLDRDPHAPKS